MTTTRVPEGPKYYVVSEGELVAYGEACLSGPAEQIVEAEAACRARPVEYVATHSNEGHAIWVEVDK